MQDPQSPHVGPDLGFLNIVVFFISAHTSITPFLSPPSQLQTKCIRHGTAHVRGHLPFTKAGARAQLGDGRASR